MKKRIYRVALYIRVSTAEQAMEGYSIGEQGDRLEQYAKAMGWVIVESYIDPGFSGSNMKRPGLQRLLADIQKFDAVLVYKLDRLSRSQKDTMHIIEDVFLKNDVAFVSMCESFDTSTPFGRAAIGLLATFAQLERENIKERMSMGMKGRIRNGNWKGTSRPPIGYDYTEGKLIVNEYEAMQIRELFEIAANGIPDANYNIRNMARYMSKKYTNKYGSWSDSTGITYIIQNKVYTGMVKYNDEYYPGKHSPIICQELFDKANSKLSIYLSEFNEHVGYNKYMLSGITYCKLCGRPYYRRNSQIKAHGVKKEYGYYSCQGRKADVAEKCPSKIFRQENLEQVVISQIEQLKYKNWFTKERADDDPSALLQQLKQLDARQDRLIDLYSIGSIPKLQIDDKIKELNLERDKINALLASRQTITGDEIIQMATTIREVDYSTKCDIVNALIEKVVIDGETVLVFWRF